jgi:hypothetical protein
MRALILGAVVVAGIGLAGASSASAAPAAGGGVLNEIANGMQPVQQAQHWRWGSRGGHWRWGSRPRGRLCHRPYTSRTFRC